MENRISETDKRTIEVYLEMFQKAVELQEYEVALTALESIRGIIADYLMEKHYGKK